MLTWRTCDHFREGVFVVTNCSAKRSFFNRANHDVGFNSTVGYATWFHGSALMFHLRIAADDAERVFRTFRRSVKFANGALNNR